MITRGHGDASASRMPRKAVVTRALAQRIRYATHGNQSRLRTKRPKVHSRVRHARDAASVRCNMHERLTVALPVGGAAGGAVDAARVKAKFSRKKGTLTVRVPRVASPAIDGR